MGLTLDSGRIAFIHDFDGVHYRYQDLPGIHDEFARLAQDSALKILKDRNIESDRAGVKALLDQTYKDRGNPTYAISNMTEDKSFALKADFNRVRHAKLFEWMKEHHSHICKIDEERIKYFEQLEIFGIQHGLLTAGEYEDFAKKFLEKNETLKHFNISCLLDFAAVDGYSKMEHARPMEVAMYCMNVEPSQVVFIEDSLKNFKPIKEYYPEILTVLVNNDEDQTSHDDVDMQFLDLNAFLKSASETFSSYHC